MRINEIESGQKEIIADSKIVRFVEIVSTECSDAWNICGKVNRLLFRGIKSIITATMFHGKPRDNRRPLASARNEQDVIDSALEKTGFTALRSNSIFCTSNESDASFYGKPFIIFPKNGFSFTWSPEISDLYVDLRSGFNSSKLNTMSPEQIVQNLGFTNDNFVAALESENEILISGEYYACELRYVNYINANIL